MNFSSRLVATAVLGLACGQAAFAQIDESKRSLAKVTRVRTNGVAFGTGRTTTLKVREFGHDDDASFATSDKGLLDNCMKLALVAMSNGVSFSVIYSSSTGTTVKDCEIGGDAPAN